MKVKSSSIHTINCDRPLNRFQRWLYILCNALNNYILPNMHDRNLKVENFRCNIAEADWASLERSRSPSRKVSDLFWLKLPWDALKEELAEIHILDTGCGKGQYALKLDEFSHSRLGSYTGLDHNVKDQWSEIEKTHDHVHFIQTKSTDITSYIPKEANFFISQSAIEHFDEDLTYFEQIRDHINNTKKNTIQIHLFPSSVCLILYLYHGARQYTPRSVSKITRMFNDFSYSVLFGLGGAACNDIHWNVITKKLLKKEKQDMRHHDLDGYERKLFQAVKQDMTKPQRYPSFYALVIHSNWKNKIFCNGN